MRAAVQRYIIGTAGLKEGELRTATTTHVLSQSAGTAAAAAAPALLKRGFLNSKVKHTARENSRNSTVASSVGRVSNQGTECQTAAAAATDASCLVTYSN